MEEDKLIKNVHIIAAKILLVQWLIINYTDIVNILISPRGILNFSGSTLGIYSMGLIEGVASYRYEDVLSNFHHGFDTKRATYIMVLGKKKVAYKKRCSQFNQAKGQVDPESHIN